MKLSAITNASYVSASKINNDKQNVVQNNTVALNTTKLPQYSYLPAKISFNGLMRMSAGSKPIDSSFFRDYDALIKTTETLKENFPNGAQILDYACSDGEEAISLYALLGDERDKFKITGVDLNEDAIELANNGIYSVFGNYLDTFLMPGAQKTQKEEELSKMFNGIMEPTEKPDEKLNTSPNFLMSIMQAKPEFQKEIFFKLNDDVKNNLEFKTGDIYKLNEENGDKKAGAIFFRNAFYHLLENFDGENIFKGDTHNAALNELGEDSFSEEEIQEMKMFIKKDDKTLEEKQKIADEIIDKVYEKLETGGVFVLGDALNDNIFIAPNDISDDDTIKFGDTKAYKARLKEFEDSLKVMQDANLYAKSTKIATDDLDYQIDYDAIMKTVKIAADAFKRQADVRILKKTPMHKALERDGRFKPVHYSKVKGLEDIEMPTVWVKVK